MRKISWVYLHAVPFMVAFLGFTLGKISYTIYLPIWIGHDILMILAMRKLSLDTLANENPDIEKILSAFFLMAPWLLISMFFGLGPPPSTPEIWVATAWEQQLRYGILILAGILLILGFHFVKRIANRRGQMIYPDIGYTLLMIALPLFLLNMLFWGFYLTQYLQDYVADQTTDRPVWYNPMRSLFGMLSNLEVFLTYIATGLFCYAMKLTNLLRGFLASIFAWISFASAGIILISLFLDPYLAGIAYFLTIPAIPFIIPYYIGLGSLKIARGTTTH